MTSIIFHSKQKIYNSWNSIPCIILFNSNRNLHIEWQSISILLRRLMTFITNIIQMFRLSWDRLHSKQQTKKILSAVVIKPLQLLTLWTTETTITKVQNKSKLNSIALEIKYLFNFYLSIFLYVKNKIFYHIKINW